MKNKDFIHLHIHSEYCLAGDTLIYNCVNHNNKRDDYTRLWACKTIKYLYDANASNDYRRTAMIYPIKVWDGERFVKSRITSIVKSKPKRLYKLTTESGKSIRASANHKFLTDSKWCRLKNLKVGDTIGCNGILNYGSILEYEKIISITKDKFEETYDIEVEHSSHNFIANGIITHNSTLDGFGTPKAYAQKAKEMGFTHLACTDHGNIDGLIKFQKACLDCGIQSLLGAELYIVPEISKERKNGHILILVKNNKGFKNLCRMLSFANTEGFYYKPRVTYDMLLKNCDGLVISTACMQSFVFSHKEGEQFVKQLKEKIGDDLYFELMPNDTELQKSHNKKIIKLARKLKSKVIISCDCHYIDKDDWKAQEVLLAIQRKAKWTDSKRFKFSMHGLHLKSAKRMQRDMKKIGSFKKEWLTNTIEVAKKCKFQIKKRDIHLPPLENIEPEEEAKTLKNLCFKGFYDLFLRKITLDKTYYARFKEEFQVIESKGVIRYFLIIKELVDWCKENNIMIGPRGSVAGCLIAYLLGITCIDPIKYNLIFSRFLNEERIDYPDIDIDFEHTKRHLIRKHLEDIYGEDHIAGISSFNRMKSKAVIRDVSRVFAISLAEVDKFAKLIDAKSEDGIQDCIEQYDEGKEFQAKYPEVVEIAKKLEGQVKARSKHAGGLIVSKEPLHESNRANLVRMKDDTVINWEMTDTEYVGLMKLDALATRILSILSYTKELVKKNKLFEIGYEAISLDDKNVLAEINSGNTVGVFQLNTWSMTQLIKNMGINKFMDIPAAIALVRPGPSASGVTDEYIKRKKSGIWEKKHPKYEKITEDTYGVICYQEQIMRVICDMAGLPYSTADNIRKIIGKKRDAKEFIPYKKQFVKGCLKEGYLSKDEANDFWKMLQECAHYSFNLSHSVSYGMIGAWCAWVKYYYPTEFICASLTHGQKDKKNELIEEAYRLGLTLVLPRVNSLTQAENWVADGNNLYIPFIEVNGIGPKKAIEAASTFHRKKATFWEDNENETIEKHKGAFGELLDTIGAYRTTNDIKLTSQIKSYFNFRLITNPTIYYEKLYKLFDKNIKIANLDPILQGDTKILKKLLSESIVKKAKFKNYESFRDKVLDCELCELRKECTQPVPSSIGSLRVSIIGEASGFEEDRDCIGFISRSGNKIWQSLDKYGYTRSDFHVADINKCYPSISRKPNANQIKICSDNWLHKELKKVKPILILAFGNNCLQYFSGRKSGITEMSGKIEWNEKYSAWIAWCIHPAATLHNSDNIKHYENGMKSFVKILNTLKKAK